MADLNPLIRVRKHAVEQKQKFLAELYRQAEQLAGQKHAIEDQIRDEQEKIKSSESIDMIRYFTVFVEAAKERIREIEDAQKKLDARIEVAREDMREAFAELKKIEITQDRREAEELAEIEKKAAEFLDETAIETYRRRQGED